MQNTSSPHNDIKEQIKFLKSLNVSHLGEFLCRSHTTNTPSLLSRAIRDELQIQHKYNNLRIHTEINQSPHYTNPPDIYLIITFKDRIIQPQATRNKHGTPHGVSPRAPRTPAYIDQKIGHITFHLIPSQCGNNASTRGPIHVINNTSTRRARRFHIRKEQQTQCMKYTFSIGTLECPGCNISDNLMELTNATINVLNRWFDPTQQTHLQYNLCDTQSIQHTQSKLNTIARWRTTRNKQRS